MEKQRCKQEIGPATVTDYNYGVSDGKGRAIGSRVALAIVRYIPCEPEALHAYYTREPGAYFGLQTSAMRGAHTFGAWTPYREFSTAGERAEALATFLRGAERRARKEAAKAGASVRS